VFLRKNMQTELMDRALAGSILTCYPSGWIQTHVQWRLLIIIAIIIKALLFLDLGTRRGWVVSTLLWPLYPPGKTRYPLYRRLGGSQGWFVRVWKILPLPWFNPRTVQSIVTRYTDWTILALFHRTVECFLEYLSFSAVKKYWIIYVLHDVKKFSQSVPLPYSSEGTLWWSH
jgi:hypothetical protein